MAEVKTAAGADHRADFQSRFGEFLREARERAGVSIEAVAQETKISKQFIIYLETGRLDRLPGQVFGRGFIKNIARYLRSDSKEMLRLYDACWGTAGAEPTKVPVVPAEETVVQTNIEKRSAPVTTDALQRDAIAAIPDIPHLPSIDSTRRRGIVLPAWLVRSVMSPHVRLSVLGGLVALMVVGVFGRWVSSQMKRAKQVAPIAAVQPATVVREDTMARSEATVDGAPIGVVVPQEEIVPANVVEKSLDTSATKPAVVAAQEVEVPLQVQGAPVAFEQILELNVSSPVDIKMTIDGKRVETTSYKVDLHRFTFHERAELMINDASAVDVVYNGKSLGVLGSKGRKRRIFFQARPSESDFPQ